MTPREAFELCRFTAACCPAQKFDEYTPDAWGLILADIRLVDAKDAVVEIKKRSPWVDPSEIIAQVRKMRAKRIDEYGPITPPADLDPDDTIAYRDWWKGIQQAIADGELKPKELDLPERNMRAIEGTFQRIPRRKS